MSNTRISHEMACRGLARAKKEAEKYSLKPKAILFRKVDKNGRVGVGYKDYDSGGQFTMLKMSEIKSMGVNVESLPEYSEFSETLRMLQEPARSYFKQAKEMARLELKRAKEEFLTPFYRARRNVYDDYMSSKEWAIKRQECLSCHGDKCVFCGADFSEIHHLHYDTLGDEDPAADIVPICSKCHREAHGIDSL